MVTIPSVPKTNFVKAEEIDDKGILTINRPNALNALNYDMLRKIIAYISQWKDNKSLILVKGRAGKAFCVGGDVASVVGPDVPDMGKKFFATDYILNYIIGSLNIPFIVLMDGITMGGGAGMSLHGRLRYSIATENTQLAMREAAIGMIPDAGSTHFFPRLQGKLGHYLEMTGFWLKGEDVLHAGIATHYCESAKLLELEKKLLQTSHSSDVKNVINDFCPKPKSEFTLSKHLDQINRTFNGSTVEEILNNLEKDNSDWAQQTIKSLRSVSPTCLKVTHRQLGLGAKFSLGECLQMEYRLNTRLVEENDFREGVRALLLTKDKNPKWSPSKIEDVNEKRVLSYFRPLPNNETLPIDVKLPY